MPESLLLEYLYTIGDFEGHYFYCLSFLLIPYYDKAAETC